MKQEHSPREGWGFLYTKMGRRLLGLLMAVSLLPLVVIGWFALESSEAALKEQSRLRLEACAGSAEAQLREFLFQARHATIALSSDPDVVAALATLIGSERTSAESAEHLARLTNAHLKRMPDAREVFVISPRGMVIASSDHRNVGQNVSSFEYFQRGRESYYPGEITRSNQDGLEWIMTSPVREAGTKRFLGVAACRIDPKVLNSITTGSRLLAQGARSQNVRIGDTGETYIVNRHRLMITESRVFSNAVLNIAVNTYPIVTAFEEGRQINADYEDYRGVNVSGASVIIPEMGWVLVTEMDFTQAFAGIEQMRKGLFLLAAALGIAVTVLAWNWTEKIIRPLTMLRLSDKALAEGREASAIVPEHSLPANELGDFVRTRNRRVKELFEKQRELNLEQKRRLHASAELEQMSYSIVHDMRAPLRAIISFGKILQEEAAERLGGEHRDYLARMITSAGRMDRLITDMLSYSRLVREELPISAVDVSKLFHDILETYPLFEGFRGQIHISPDLPMVQGNDAALSQCFARILENAIKFAKPGIPVEVHVEAEERPGKVRIWVRDNGIGLPAHLKGKVFGIFQQGTRSEHETGIGLALVRAATERMGGSVGVESEAGVGSAFWIDLPAVAARATVQQLQH